MIHERKTTLTGRVDCDWENEKDVIRISEYGAREKLPVESIFRDFAGRVVEITIKTVDEGGNENRYGD